MTNETRENWIQDLTESGILRAIASGGMTRGDGKRARHGSYAPLAVYLALIAAEGSSPPLREIQRLTGIGSTNTVSKSIDTLETLGLIAVERLAAGNRYEVLPLPGFSLPNPSTSARSSRTRPGNTRATTFRGPDGHLLRSPVELVVDILLHCCNVPHAVEVPYSAVFEGFDGKHSMDFLLTPKVGIEVWGASGPDYKERRRRKEAVARECGFTLHGVESVEDAYRLIPALAEQLGDTFGAADGKSLHRLLQMYRQSRGYRDTLPSVVTLKARLVEVEADEPKGTRKSEQEMLDDYWLNPYAGRPGLSPGSLRPSVGDMTLTDPELRDAQGWVRRAAKAARSAAEHLERNVVAEGTRAARTWSSGTLGLLEQARARLDDADCHLGRAKGILQRKSETPEQIAQRLQQQKDAEENESRLTKALRVYRRIESALQGGGNPYAASDAKRAREAKREALRTLIADLLPDFSGRADVSRIDDAVDAIEDEMHPEELANIL